MCSRFFLRLSNFPCKTVIDSRGGIHALVTRRPGERLRPRSGHWSLISAEGELTPTCGMRIDFEDTDRNQNQRGHFSFEIEMISRFRYRVTREQCSIRSTREFTWYDRREDKFETNIEFLKNFDPKFVSSSGLLLQVIGGIFPFFRVQQFLNGMSVYSIEPGKLRNSEMARSSECMG
jgi:hypothetical protein